MPSPLTRRLAVAAALLAPALAQVIPTMPTIVNGGFEANGGSLDGWQSQGFVISQDGQGWQESANDPMTGTNVGYGQSMTPRRSLNCTAAKGVSTNAQQPDLLSQVPGNLQIGSCYALHVRRHAFEFVLIAQYDAAIPGGAQDPTSASLVIRFGSVEHSCTCVDALNGPEADHTAPRRRRISRCRRTRRLSTLRRSSRASAGPPTTRSSSAASTPTRTCRPASTTVRDVRCVDS